MNKDKACSTPSYSGLDDCLVRNYQRTAEDLQFVRTNKSEGEIFVKKMLLGTQQEKQGKSMRFQALQQEEEEEIGESKIGSEHKNGDKPVLDGAAVRPSKPPNKNKDFLGKTQVPMDIAVGVQKSAKSIIVKRKVRPVKHIKLDPGNLTVQQSFKNPSVIVSNLTQRILKRKAEFEKTRRQLSRTTKKRGHLEAEEDNSELVAVKDELFHRLKRESKASSSQMDAPTPIIVASPGNSVRLKGFTTSTEFNGMLGTILSVDDSRYIVSTASGVTIDISNSLVDVLPKDDFQLLPCSKKKSVASTPNLETLINDLVDKKIIVRCTRSPEIPDLGDMPNLTYIASDYESDCEQPYSDLPQLVSVQKSIIDRRQFNDIGTAAPNDSMAQNSISAKLPDQDFVVYGVGTPVILNGLVLAKDFNGMHGSVVDFTNNRYVILTSSGAKISVSVSNVFPIPKEEVLFLSSENVNSELVGSNQPRPANGYFDSADSVINSMVVDIAKEINSQSLPKSSANPEATFSIENHPEIVHSNSKVSDFVVNKLPFGNKISPKNFLALNSSKTKLNKASVHDFVVYGVGTPIILDGLVTATEFNGMRGSVVDFANNRYVIRTSSRINISVPMENVFAVPEEEVLLISSEKTNSGFVSHKEPPPVNWSSDMFRKEELSSTTQSTTDHQRRYSADPNQNFVATIGSTVRIKNMSESPGLNGLLATVMKLHVADFSSYIYVQLWSSEELLTIHKDNVSVVTIQDFTQVNPSQTAGRIAPETRTHPERAQIMLSPELVSGRDTIEKCDITTRTPVMPISLSAFSAGFSTKLDIIPTATPSASSVAVAIEEAALPARSAPAAADVFSLNSWSSPRRAVSNIQDPSSPSQFFKNTSINLKKLESLSLFSTTSLLDPIIWFERGKGALRSQAIFGAEFSEQQAIAAMMDRAEAGSAIATWFGSQKDTSILSTGVAFEKAFRKRFGSSRTVEAALDKLGTIKSTAYKSLDEFYGQFSDLVAVVGVQRSHQDLVRNLLDAIPPNIRMLVLIKTTGLSGSVDPVLIPLDDLFGLAKEMVNAEKHKNMLQISSVSGVRMLNVHDQFSPEAFTRGDYGNQCTNCNSWHDSKTECIMAVHSSPTRFCYGCNSPDHIRKDCPIATAGGRKCFTCGRMGHIARDCRSTKPNPHLLLTGANNQRADNRPGFLPGRPNFQNPNQIGSPVRPKVTFANNPPAVMQVSVTDLILNTRSDKLEELCEVGWNTLSINPVSAHVNTAYFANAPRALWERTSLAWLDSNGLSVSKAVLGLIDSGAEVSCVNSNLVELWKERSDLIINTAGNSCRKVATASGSVVADVLPNITISLRNFRINVDLVVLPLGAIDMIIGMDLLSAIGAVISCNPLSLSVNDPSLLNERVQDHAVDTTSGVDIIPDISAYLVHNQHDPDRLEEWSRQDPVLPACADIPPLWEKSDISDETFGSAVAKAVRHIDDPDLKIAAENLLWEYKDIFRENVNTLRPMNCPPMKINTVHNNPVGRRTNDNYSTEQLLFLDKELPRLEKLGVLRKSISLYNNPPVVVHKAGAKPEDVQFRLCNDFRQLNEVTIPVEAFIPRIREVLGSTAGSNIFSKLDLTAGFFQMVIAEEDRCKTAFTTHLGSYEFNVSGLGMKNVPAFFNFAIANIFIDLRRKVRTFFDDFIAHSPGIRWKESVSNHIGDLTIVFKRCRENNIILNLKKSDLFQPEIGALGFRLAENSILLPLSITGSLERLQTPKSGKEVSAFVGWAGYYRTFIKDFSDIVAPLNRLTLARAVFAWTEDCQRAFISLRNALGSNPILRNPVKADHPDFQPLTVETDASDWALGAVLGQASIIEGKLVDHACAYLSRQLSAPERNYSTGDRELLAVVYAVEKWRFVLLEHHFTIITDHKALIYLMTQKQLSGRLARQAMMLQGYNFSIGHRPGAQHANADGLSRLRFSPEESSVIMAVILGISVETSGVPLSLQECWLDVAAVALPENRPAQALRETGNSVLVFTVSQIGVDEGIPGQRLSRNIPVAGAQHLSIAQSVLAITRRTTPTSGSPSITPSVTLERAVSLIPQKDGSKPSASNLSVTLIPRKVGRPKKSFEVTSLSSAGLPSVISHSPSSGHTLGDVVSDVVSDNSSGKTLVPRPVIYPTLGVVEEETRDTNFSDVSDRPCADTLVSRKPVIHSAKGVAVEETRNANSAHGNVRPSGEALSPKRPVIHSAKGVEKTRNANSPDEDEVEIVEVKRRNAGSSSGSAVAGSSSVIALDTISAPFLGETLSSSNSVIQPVTGVVLKDGWTRVVNPLEAKASNTSILLSSDSMEPSSGDTLVSRKPVIHSAIGVKGKLTRNVNSLDGAAHESTVSSAVENRSTSSFTGQGGGITVPGCAPPLKYHEEIWLSGAVNLLRGEPNTATPSKWARKIEEQSRSYRIMFSENGCPIAIFSVPKTGSLLPEKTMEIPAPARRVVLVAAAHEFGHFAADKTANRLWDQGFDWLGILQDCQVIISACRPCARDNAHRKVWAPAASLVVPGRVFERVHMDLLMLPLVEVTSGSLIPPFQYLLLFVCALSKYPIAFCLTAKESTIIAKALWSVICMFGPMVVLNSDNGLEFCNDAVSSLANLHGISRRLTSAYRPQSNGAVERLNRSIIAVLRKLTSGAPQKWYEWVDFVLMAIRTAIHRSSGYSPFQIMFGRLWNPLANYHQMALDFDVLQECPDGIQVVESALLVRAQQLRQHLGWVAGAQINGVVQANKSRVQADAQHNVGLSRISVGSLVWRVNHTPSSKLDIRLLGPFRIAVADEDVTDISANYHLESLLGSSIERTVPRDQLVVLAPAVWLSVRQKELYSATELEAAAIRLSNVEPGPVDFVEGAASFAVEYILKERIVKRQKEVLVKWVGYSTPSWILETDVPVEIRSKLWSNGQKFQN